MPKVSITGEIIRINKLNEISEKFKVREFWVKEVEGNYPNTFSIQAINVMTQVLHSYKEGDVVDIECNLSGRHWQKNGKEGVMNGFNLASIKIHGSVAENNIPPVAQQQPTAAAPTGNVQGKIQEPVPTESDLPF